MKTKSVFSRTVSSALLASLVCSSEIYAMERPAQSQIANAEDRDKVFTETMSNLKKLEENWKYNRNPENQQKIVDYIYQEMVNGSLPKPNDKSGAAGSLKWVVNEIVNNVLALRSSEQNSLSQQLKRYLEKGEQPQGVQKDQPSEKEAIVSDVNKQTQPIDRGKQLAGIIDELKSLEVQHDFSISEAEKDDLKREIVSIIATQMKNNNLPVENEPKSSEVQGERPEDVKYVVDEVLKKLFTQEERSKSNSFYKRVMEGYFLGNKQGTFLAEDFIESKEIDQGKSSEKSTEMVINPISQDSMGQSITVLDTLPDSSALNSLKNPSEKFSDSPGIKDYGTQVAQQALNGLIQNSALPIKGYSLMPVPAQGWNSITFDVNDQTTGKPIYVAKLAKGDDLNQIQSLQSLFSNKLNINLLDSADIKSKRGIDGIGIPIYLFSISVKGENQNNYSLQIMPYLERGNFTEILKRLCDGSWWENNGNRKAYWKLMELFGQAIGRFQRGGPDADTKIPTMTLVHGDLFTEHVLVGNFNNYATYVPNVQPKFALIDLPTLAYVEDPDCTKLLVDPMFLSSLVFFEFKKQNFRQGILDMFNNFYLGYVQEFSGATLDKLYDLFKNSDNAFAAFEKAADYANSVGKDMKTRQKDDFEGVSLDKNQRRLLEGQLADLHRLAFLHAYFKIIKKNDSAVQKVLTEESDWINKWKTSGLSQKLGMTD